VDPEVRRIATAAVRRFTEAGRRVEERAPGWPDPTDFHRVIYEVQVAGRQIDRAESVQSGPSRA